MNKSLLLNVFNLFATVNSVLLTFCLFSKFKIGFNAQTFSVLSFTPKLCITIFSKHCRLRYMAAENFKLHCIISS